MVSIVMNLSTDDIDNVWGREFFDEKPAGLINNFDG